MSRRLNNYLRTYRKRSGLTQDEVALLLGAKSGTKVSRYERFRRRPTIETVFAYEVLFRTPSRELFAGLYREVERETVKRAGHLADRLQQTPPSRLTARKLEALHQVVYPTQHAD